MFFIYESAVCRIKINLDRIRPAFTFRKWRFDLDLYKLK